MPEVARTKRYAYVFVCLVYTCVICCEGCPANEATNEEGVTPQKMAKTDGFKDGMKELKKLTTFQDKVARGTKPKGFAEPWAVTVSG